jgi:hypothetical protein
MKTRHLRARLPDEEYRAIQVSADSAGLTLSEHVRNLILRDRQALSQEQLLVKIDAKLAAICQPFSGQKVSADLEPLIVESLLMIRELVAERNAQVLGRVAHQMNSNYPERKKI